MNEIEKALFLLGEAGVSITTNSGIPQRIYAHLDPRKPREPIAIYLAADEPLELRASKSLSPQVRMSQKSAILAECVEYVLCEKPFSESVPLTYDATQSRYVL